MITSLSTVITPTQHALKIELDNLGGINQDNYDHSIELITRLSNSED